MNVERGEFFLKGYLNKDPIEFSFSQKTIRIISDINKQIKLEQMHEKLNDFSETSVLTILGFETKEKLLNIALDIKNLLSIVLGRRITFDKQKYWIGESFESVEKKMSKNANESRVIIPEFELKQFLEQSLPIWSNYSKEEKDNIFTIFDYLNQTSLDFIEDRVLRTVQAWECYGHYFIKDIELTDELKELKKRIKETYKNWKKDFDYNDQEGEIGNRLSISLDQEKLLLKLNNIIQQSGLLVDKIKLKFRELKDLRDQVAHSGRIEITDEKAYNYLKPGVVGLQLIVLRKLGYSGLVYGEQDGCRTLEKIEEYFK